jgi:hypothetical protein
MGTRGIIYLIFYIKLLNLIKLQYNAHIFDIKVSKVLYRDNKAFDIFPNMFITVLRKKLNLNLIFSIVVSFFFKFKLLVILIIPFLGKILLRDP